MSSVILDAHLLVKQGPLPEAAVVAKQHFDDQVVLPLDRAGIRLNPAPFFHPLEFGFGGDLLWFHRD